MNKKQDGEQQFNLQFSAEAEVKLSSTSPVEKSHSAQHVVELLQELRAHPIELEMQNEKLPSAYAALEASLDSYFTHYIEEAEDMADRIGVISKGELIVVEDKAVLIRKLGKKQLTLTLRQPMTSIPVGLSAWSLALAEDGHALIYSFDTQEEETGIAELLRTLAHI